METRSLGDRSEAPVILAMRKMNFPKDGAGSAEVRVFNGSGESLTTVLSVVELDKKGRVDESFLT
jgi:hypothetical protein